MKTNTYEALKIFFTGVGGQGTLLATRYVGEAALEEGIPVNLSEIHGMAQRGGVVESSVVIGNVFSPTIPDGEADILMAFEPLEAARAISKCHRGTIVIVNTVPIVPFTVAIGQSAYPELEKLIEMVESKVALIIRVDAVKLARQAGSEKAANIALTGVLAGTGRLAVSSESWREALKRIVPPKLLEINQKAFELGYCLGADTTERGMPPR
jgi:indolepyruvate ferredoxin oxidoreductase, beta subunit